jgi:hypothetical protein
LSFQRIIEAHVQSLIDPAFVFGFVDGEAADCGGGRHVGAAAGLFIEGFNGDDADLAVDDGGRDFEGAEEIRAGAELSFGEIPDVERVGAVENGVDFGFEFGADDRGKPFPFEVDAGVRDVDLSAGDPGVVIAEGDGVEDVEDGVIAGESLTARDVEAEGDGEAGGEFGVSREMPEDAVRVRLYLGDGESDAAGEGERAVVAGLPAATGVEAGLVKGDGVFADGEDGGRGFVAMVVEPV